MKTLYALSVLSLLAAPVFAVDGVVLINQSIALAGGVTPGDTPGFPVTISVSGSYRLSGNLVVPDANTTAIEVTANNVTIDLNGFSIIGPTVCGGGGNTGVPFSCSPTGVGFGIQAGLGFGLSVSNGYISGMGSLGISGSPNSRIDNVRVLSNGGGGINLGLSNSLVTNCTVRANGLGGGIQAAQVIGNVVDHNGGVAILASSLVLNNSVLNNGNDGIDLISGFNGTGALISGNNVFQNGGIGINAACPTNIVGNSVNQNTGGNITTSGSGCTRVNNLPTP